MRHCAKFRRNQSTRGRDMAIFRFSKMVAVAILDFQNFWNFNGRNAQKGQNATLCQISSKWIKPRPRYGDFSMFQDGGRRHLEFLNFWNLNGRNAQKGENASLCQISSKSVKPRPRYGDFSIFQDGGLWVGTWAGPVSTQANTHTKGN